ncbi:MAG: hypothetical protein Q7S00_02540 [bacterium]|nr:hypothetical protein [bacterium]
MVRFIRTVLFLGVLSFSFPLSATMVRPLTLGEITKKADKIFSGRCQSVRSVVDEQGLPATLVTFEVDEKIKGEVGDVEEVKLFGLPKKTVLDDDGLLPTHPSSSYSSDVQEFQEGEENVLFLYKKSEWGYTSPIGNGQGRFRVQALSSGESSVTNSFDNLFLFQKGKDLKTLQSMSVTEEGTFEKEGFLKSVRDLVKRGGQ